jgi:hypothetical protein
VNYCRSCREDFSSIANFDRHRVGKHEYTYWEGLKFDPPVEDGRRCLRTQELVGRGFRRDKYGRWSDPTRTPEARLRAMHNRTEAFL